MNSTPTSSNGGRPLQNSSSMTHWLKDSAITGQRSVTPKVRATAARSSGVVFGVILSTIVEGKATFSSIHLASTGSRRAANDTSAVRAALPLLATLSHETTVNGAIPARRRSSKADARYAQAVMNGPDEARSARTAGDSSSKSGESERRQ